MNCLLVAATAQEITPFLKYFRNSEVKPDFEIDVLISGVGLTATTYSLGRQIAMRKPQIVTQAGIAGCFDKNIPLGSVVMIRKDTIADQSVVEHNQLKTMFDLGLIRSNRSPFTRGWLVNPYRLLMNSMKLKSVAGISVNHLTTNKRMIEWYRDKFNPATESMEGAAVHYACLMEKIPFLQIRAVSNYVGERDKKKWRIGDAVANLNNCLVDWVAATKVSRITITDNFKP